MDSVVRVDDHEEERRKWKAYHRSAQKYHTAISKESSKRGLGLSEAYLVFVYNQLALCDLISVQ